jgi:hypothetical protein
MSHLQIVKYRPVDLSLWNLIFLLEVLYLYPSAVITSLAHPVYSLRSTTFTGMRGFNTYFGYRVLLALMCILSGAANFWCYLHQHLQPGARVGTVVRSNALLVRRSRIRLSMLWMEFFYLYNPSDLSMPPGSTQPLTEMSTTNIS